MKHPKRTAQQIRNFLPRVLFATLLGIKLTRLHRDGVTIECVLRHELTNSAGVAHGGVAAALVDAAVGMALHRHFGGGARSPPWKWRSTIFYRQAKGAFSPALGFYGSAQLYVSESLTSPAPKAPGWAPRL